MYAYTNKRRKRFYVEYVEVDAYEETSDIRYDVSDASVDVDIFQKPESGPRVASVHIVSARGVNTFNPGLSSGQDTSVTRHIP